MIPAAHLHLILNHLPVVGSLFSLGLLAWAFWRRSEDVQRAALGAAVVVALVAIPAYLTGEPAWIDIMDVPGDNDDFILAHQSAAQFAFGASTLAGILALISLVAGRKGKPVPARLVTAVFVMLLITTGLMGYVANLGGKIRHTEIRPGGLVEEAKK